VAYVPYVVSISQNLKKNKGTNSLFLSILEKNLNQ